MDVRDVLIWELVDERLDQMRRLPHGELVERTHTSPEVEQVERPWGVLRRWTRVVQLPNDRLGIRVRVDADGRKPRAEAAIIITSSGELAPEWSRRDEPPQGNPFAVGPRASLAVLVLWLTVLAVFIMLAGGAAA